MIHEKIHAALASNRRVFSFEFFPPKTEKGEDALYDAVRELVPMKPTFVSVTYGAGGSTREKTCSIVCNIQNTFGLTTMAHMTCLGHSYEELRTLLKRYQEHGVHDVLALRGDRPKPDATWKLVDNGPTHAIELVQMAQDYGVESVGVAGFPETHPEATSLEADIHYLKEKVDAGAQFVITQLFFDNAAYFRYVEKARAAGITVPILPGIMPVTAPGQIDRFQELSGCSIPPILRTQLEAWGDDEERVREAGLAYCTAQCVDLLEKGAPGIHFYTLNKSRACHAIHAALRVLGYWDA